MQANRSRDTQPEILVRRLLHARGLRYRVDVRPVPSLRRRADIVFTRKHIAVFIDGCFWHGCPEHGTRQFKPNITYWTDKIARNVCRDLETVNHLQEEGWTVLRYWEHVRPEEVVASIEAEYRRRS
jgi:DNA mismatch endonuclease (patch repair protein)